MPGDEAVAVDFLFSHAEIVRAVGDQLVGLFESALVEQELDALAGRHLAFFVLAFPALRTAAFLGQVIAPLQFGQFLFAVHREEIIAGGKDRAGSADECHWADSPWAAVPT